MLGRKRRGGSPAYMHIPAHTSRVRVLMEAGVPCDKIVKVAMPATTIKLRDWNKRPNRKQA